MEIFFEKTYLKELYENGKATNKKYRFQDKIIVKFIQTIDIIKAEERIEDLFLKRSLNYKKLKGNKKGLESVRVNNKYRIEFKSKIEGEAPNRITICSIIELSNHYK